jgi:anti-anti-sigma regulatory factor/HAMP domain-containing protein
VAVHARFLSECPNTARAFLRGILAAQQALHTADAAQREAIADLVSGPAYLNVGHRRFVAQALSGHLSDGTGRDLVVAKYVDFRPHFPLAHAEWMISQMQRWGQLPMDVDSAELAHRVYHCSLLNELTAGTDLAPDPGNKAIVPTPIQLDVTQQAFAAPRKTTSEPKRYEMSEKLRTRFGEILQHLAEVAGGRMSASLEITSQDEVGWLEQVLNEVVRSAKYIQQALSAEVEAVAEAESRRQRAIIEAQRELVMQLSTPIIPLLPSTLLVPLIGTIDVERALRISESILAAVSAHRARTVLLDVTGLKTLDAAVAGSLRQVATAIRLLGSQCVLVGVSPQVASQLVALDSDLTDISVFRNVASAVEYALERQRTVRALSLQPGSHDTGKDS